MRLYVAVAAAMIGDLVTFAWVMPLVGLQAESNPLMVRTYLELGMVGVAILKFAALVVILSILSRVKVPSMRRLAAGIGVTIGLFGFVGNLTALLR